MQKITPDPEVVDIFVCACHDRRHNFIVSYYKDEKETYIGVRLNHLPFFQRLWKGIKYIFKYDDAEYGEVILTEQKLNELIQVLAYRQNV